jgi:predicted nucleic acid-binding protein
LAPSAQHDFDEEPLPQAVVLDSDFVISVLHENEEFHEVCVAFAARLRSGNVRVVHTPLLRVDFWNGWRQALRRRGVPIEATQGLEGRGQATGHLSSYRGGDRLLMDFLSSFAAYELELSEGLLDEALNLIARYNLRPHDGCLAATAFYSGVNAIVSLDGDFINVGWPRIVE